MSEYVQSENPVLVKITNGANGSLNIHGVVAKSYEKDCANAVKTVVSNDLQMWYSMNTLNFRSEKTCPAEVVIMSVDGRKIDVPFRGWIEGGVENKIQLNLNHLSKGLYIFILTTNEGKTSLKIQK